MTKEKNQQIQARIERAKLYIPHEGGEITFVFPSFGLSEFKSTDYQSTGKKILAKGLKVPTGDFTASLLYSSYCDLSFFDEPEFEDLRLVRKFWVFDQNYWTDNGLYVREDVAAEGIDKPVPLNELEQAVLLENGAREIKGTGVRISSDGRIRYAELGSYTLGKHTPQELLKQGDVIARHGVEGADKLAEVSTRFPNKSITTGAVVSKENKPKLRFSALAYGCSEYDDTKTFLVCGDKCYGYGGHALGVL